MPETASDACNPDCSNFQILQIHIFIRVFPRTHYTMYSNELTRGCCHTVFYVFTLIKCTLVQALRLRTGSTAHRGSRGIALFFYHHGTRRGWGVSVTPRPLFTPGKDPVPIVQEAGWAITERRMGNDVVDPCVLNMGTGWQVISHMLLELSLRRRVSSNNCSGKELGRVGPIYGLKMTDDKTSGRPV